MLYKPVKLNIPEKIHNKIKTSITGGKKPVSIKVNLDGEADHTLLLTRGQIAKLERARLIGKKSFSVRLSRKQVQVNVKHEGGFLGMLIAALSAAIPSIISAVTAAAPAVLAGVATGAISGAVEKAISGNGLYLYKKGEGCAKVQLVKGGGLYLTPHPNLHPQGGNGLYLKHDERIYGNGQVNPLIKDKAPILGLIL